MARWIPRDSNTRRLLSSAVSAAALSAIAWLFGEWFVSVLMLLVFGAVMAMLYASERTG